MVLGGSTLPFGLKSPGAFYFQRKRKVGYKLYFLDASLIIFSISFCFIWSSRTPCLSSVIFSVWSFKIPSHGSIFVVTLVSNTIISCWRFSLCNAISPQLFSSHRQTSSQGSLVWQWLSNSCVWTLFRHWRNDEGFESDNKRQFGADCCSPRQSVRC